MCHCCRGLAGAASLLQIYQIYAGIQITSGVFGIASARRRHHGMEASTAVTYALAVVSRAERHEKHNMKPLLAQ